MGFERLLFGVMSLGADRVREENLQGLLYTLNKIMILNYQSKPYRMAEEEKKMVAENEGTGYKGNGQLC